MYPNSEFWFYIQQVELLLFPRSSDFIIAGYNFITAS